MSFLKTLRSARFGALGLAAVVAVAACQDEERGISLLEPSDLALDAVVADLSFSSLTATPDEIVRVSLRAAAPEGLNVTALDGSLLWDPSLASFEGQFAQDGTIAMVNESRADAGVMPLVVANPYGLGADAAVFAFKVKGNGYDAAFSFVPGVAVEYDGRELDLVAGEKAMDRGLDSFSQAQRMDVDDWIRHLGGEAVEFGGSQAPGAAGTSNVFGDTNNDGSVNATDVGHVANASVGNAVLGPITTAAPRDAVAVNVQPFNLPGLGEPGDALPPGDQTDGTRKINASDVSVIAQEAVGLDRPVVGESIPRAPASPTFACFPGTGTYVSAFTDCENPDPTVEELVVTSDVTLTNDRIWILGEIIFIGRDGTRTADLVGGAQGTVAQATLTIEPGTTLWGTLDGALAVTRAGRIEAVGTASMPITMTCVEPTSGPRVVTADFGCWGGLVVAGNATLPDDNVDGLEAVIAGRNGGGGLSGVVEGFPSADVYYGGDNDLDDCGTLRYVRVAYGGEQLNANDEFNNVTIAGCGSGTDISYLHAHHGSDDGLEIFGGTYDIHHIYLTSNLDDQFDYSYGWDGNAQYVLVQQLGYGDKGFEVDNTEDSGTYDNAPRTAATLYNFTMVGGTDASTTYSTANNYRRGAWTQAYNGLIVQYGRTFDIDNAQSCAAIVPGDLRWNNTLLLSSSATSYAKAGDADPTADGSNVTCGALGSPERLLMVPSNVVETSSGLQGTNTLMEGRAYAGELASPFSGQLPDFRPVGAGATAAFGPATPPAPFGVGNWFGAFEPAQSTTGDLTSLPWSHGWVLAWQEAALP